MRTPHCRSMIMLNSEDGPLLAEALLGFLSRDPQAPWFLGEVDGGPEAVPGPVASGAITETWCPLCLAFGAPLKPDLNGGRFLECNYCFTRFFMKHPRAWTALDRLLAFLGRDPQHQPWLLDRLAAARMELDLTADLLSRHEAQKPTDDPA